MAVHPNFHPGLSLTASNAASMNRTTSGSIPERLCRRNHVSAAMAHAVHSSVPLGSPFTSVGQAGSDSASASFQFNIVKPMPESSGLQNIQDKSNDSDDIDRLFKRLRHWNESM